MSDSQEPSSPYSARWWQASALFLAVVLVTGAVVVFTSDDESQAPAAAGPTASASGSVSASPTGNGDCPKLATSTDIPRTAPTADWALVSTVAVPTSKDAGPAVVDGDVARCFAHSPTGALFAGAQIGTRYAFTKDWEKVVEKQTYGDGKQVLLDKRRAYEATAEPVAPVPGELGQFAGFQFVTYTPQTAVLQMVSRFEAGTMQVSTVTLKWDTGRGDWLYEIPSVTPPQKTVDTLDGYVVWGGL
ncbi:hypothetical protein OHB49_45615 (plasmid) [Streptomyces sp. NBC_01717]|uniref:hypothetical protein n=1 Tax=Streptomyces sp. NBC_01717 TaxID=2975918 RepID=UPI002E36EEC8|nr:hypothetical protein [Streptomyces sp. NBC_01717]